MTPHADDLPYDADQICVVPAYSFTAFDHGDFLQMDQSGETIKKVRVSHFHLQIAVDCAASNGYPFWGIAFILKVVDEKRYLLYIKVRQYVPHRPPAQAYTNQGSLSKA